MVFGFPEAESRGHNISPLQNGFIEPRALATLEREDQFLRGSIVIVSSRNSAISSPTPNNPAIKLDLVGQDFIVTCVDPEPNAGDEDGDFSLDVHSDVDDDPTTEDGLR